MKRHQDAAIRMLAGLSPGRVLDAGSAGNEMGRALETMGFTVFSLDLFETPPIKGRFVRADMNHRLPYKDRAFDYVLCSESLQYLDNHAMLLREFKRITRKNGSVILSMPNVLNANSRLYLLRRGYYPHFKPGPMRSVDPAKAWDDCVYNPVDLLRLIGLMEKNGMRLKAMTASKIKAKSIPLSLALRALYSLELLFEKRGAKAELIKRLSSFGALAGDHIVMRFAEGEDA